MHDVSNDLVPSNLKDLFVPPANETPSLQYTSFGLQAFQSDTQKLNTEVKRKLCSRIGAKLCNEIPTNIRALPKATFKKKI